MKEYSWVTCSSPLKDIVVMEYKNLLEVNLRIAEDLVASRLDFTDNKPHFLLVDLANIKHVDNLAKAYLQHADTGLKNIVGAAFVAKNPLALLMANIFVKTKTNFQSRVFETKEVALLWLREVQRSQ